MAIYFDNSSTTMVCPEAIQAAVTIMSENYGNPSSTHIMGRQAKKALDNSRSVIATALGAEPGEIFFTSGGTEADNWAVRGGANYMHHKGKHIISSQAEHDAILKSLDILESEGFEVTRLKPQPDGSISPQDLSDALRPDTVLVSLMMVNNETGSINDIPAMRDVLTQTNSQALLHTDAVQAFMKLPISVKSLGADMISISSHKIHGPKGVGTLYIKKGLHPTPILFGGGQESGVRPGTEGLPQIAAFAAAAQASMSCAEETRERMYLQRKWIITTLKSQFPQLLVNGGGAPHILSVSLPGYKSEVIMNFLETEDICVSKSSACKKGGRSHVLTAMGLSSKNIDGAIRIGLSRYTTEEECQILCSTLISATEKLFKSR